MYLGLVASAIVVFNVLVIAFLARASTRDDVAPYDRL